MISQGLLLINKKNRINQFSEKSYCTIETTITILHFERFKSAIFFKYEIVGSMRLIRSIISIGANGENVYIHTYTYMYLYTYICTTLQLLIEVFISNQRSSEVFSHNADTIIILLQGEFASTIKSYSCSLRTFTTAI